MHIYLAVPTLCGDCLEKTEIVTIRVPKGTKAFAKREKIRLGAEFREFISARRRAASLLKEYAAIEQRAKMRRVSGNSAEMIRKDRDSR